MSVPDASLNRNKNSPRDNLTRIGGHLCDIYIRETAVEFPEWISQQMVKEHFRGSASNNLIYRGYDLPKSFTS
jgi:hypothetical protein